MQKSPKGKKKGDLSGGGMKRLPNLARSVSKQEKHFVSFYAVVPSETHGRIVSSATGTSGTINHLSNLLINM